MKFRLGQPKEAVFKVWGALDRTGKTYHAHNGDDAHQGTLEPLSRVQEQWFFSSSTHRIGGYYLCQGVFSVFVAAQQGNQYDDSIVLPSKERLL
jgi:hypothetical protein